MLLISTTHQPATDLGYLLHKHPGHVHSFDQSFGNVVVAYPEASPERTTVALLLDLDPVRLVRGKGEAQGSVAQYVNDRPYVASSFLSVAIGDVFRTAMQGKCKEKQELAETAIPLEVRLPVLPARGGEAIIRRLFEPLGYEVMTKQLPLDEHFPEWGHGNYFDLTLKGTLRLSEALRHVYLLLPVLDARKHYYMDQGEVQKLVDKGAGWLETHPEKDWIIRASLGRKPSLMREALEQLANVETELIVEAEESETTPEEPRQVSLHELRHRRVIDVIKEIKPKSVLDLGCGDGKLLREVIKVQGVDRILGMDVSFFEIEKARRRLHLEDAGPRMRERIELVHGSLMYRDARLEGFEVCTVVEVIEHLDPPRLAAFERVVFGCAAPKIVIVTTPDRTYNAVYGLDEMRHKDHRFEWNREEFTEWGTRVADRYGYTVEFEGIGDAHEEFGQPSQMAVFRS